MLNGVTEIGGWRVELGRVGGDAEVGEEDLERYVLN